MKTLQDNPRLLSTFQKLVAIWHRIIQRTQIAWDSAKVLEKISFSSLIVAAVFHLMHLVEISEKVFGMDQKNYVLTQNMLVFGGLVALLLSAHQRLGAVIQELMHTKRSGELERQNVLQEFDRKLREEQERHTAVITRLQMDHAAELREAVSRRGTFFRNFHNTAHLTRDLLMLLLQSADPPPLDKVVATLSEFCTQISEFLGQLYGRKYTFRVAVKGLISNDEVVTLARDQRTLKARPPHKDQNVRHSLERNTAFCMLRSGQLTIYACDNLNESATYLNETPGWERLYNATAVVPIRRTFDNGSFELAGFLGVDCMLPQGAPRVFCVRRKGKDEPDEAIRNLLLGYADIMFALIKRGRLTQPRANGRTFTTDKTNFPFVMNVHNTFVNGDWRNINALFGHIITGVQPSRIHNFDDDYAFMI